MFKIVKKLSGFWHYYNNDSKKVNLSQFNVVLDSVAQTYVIQSLNGSNIPNVSVGIADIEVIDETDASLVETFASVELLKIRLVALAYTPYIGETPPSGGSWGTITGTLSDQTDLQGALDTKIESVQAGTNVTVDDTDPLNPIVNATGGIQDLQSVLDEGGYAESPNTKSYVSYLLDDVDAEVILTIEEDGVQRSEIRLRPTELILERKDLVNDTTNILQVPISDNNTNFSVPSDKPVGSYIISTLDDIGSNTVQAMVDADITPNANTTLLETTVNLGTDRTVTLPTGMPLGKSITIKDSFQTVMRTGFKVYIVPPTGKKLNGVTNGTYWLGERGQSLTFTSDGADNFTFGVPKKECKFFAEGQGGSGFVNLVIKKNTTFTDFNTASDLLYISAGEFSSANFDKTKHEVYARYHNRLNPTDVISGNDVAGVDPPIFGNAGAVFGTTDFGSISDITTAEPIWITITETETN